MSEYRVIRNDKYIITMVAVIKLFFSKGVGQDVRDSNKAQ